MEDTEKKDQKVKTNAESKKPSKKEKEVTATQRIWSFIKQDHPFENWLLLILAIVLLVLAVYILVAAASDKNTFADTYFDISKSGWGIFDASWKIIVIASLIVALAAGVIVYCVWPVFKPAFKEMKFVTWTDKKTLFVNSLIVLIFIAFLTGLFYIFDLGLIPLFNLIFGA